MRLPITTVDVFTSEALAGNQLAVFGNAGGLSTATMQALAREMNYAESTFITGGQGNDIEVRIFTPQRELPFAGHPSLGTAAVVSGFADADMVLQLKVGPVPVRVRRTDFGAYAEVLAPESRRIGTVDPRMLAAVGASPEAVAGEPEIWSAGTPFAIVPLRSTQLLEQTRPATSADPGWPVGILLFARTGPRNVVARVFVPGDAVPEDPATGSANALLAAYLHAHDQLELGVALRTEQGARVNRPSQLTASLERDGEGRLRARVGGGVVKVIEGALDTGGR